MNLLCGPMLPIRCGVLVSAAARLLNAFTFKDECTC